MRALGLAFALAACSGCVTPSLPVALPGNPFAAETDGPAADFPIRLLTVGESLAGLGLPLSMNHRTWPAAVSRTVDAVQPGGELLWSGRMYGARGDGYLVESRFDRPSDPPATGDGIADIRSVWIDAAGKVLERTHTLAPADTPAAILSAAAKTVGGATTVVRVDVVWGPVLEEGFRVILRDEEERSWVVRTDLDGDVFGVGQIRRAALTAWRS